MEGLLSVRAGQRGQGGPLTGEARAVRQSSSQDARGHQRVHARGALGAMDSNYSAVKIIDSESDSSGNLLCMAAHDRVQEQGVGLRFCSNIRMKTTTQGRFFEEPRVAEDRAKQRGLLVEGADTEVRKRDVGQSQGERPDEGVVGSGTIFAPGSFAAYLE